MKPNIAIISPNQNAYSETFIQNHRKHFDGNVIFYYGGYLPHYLNGNLLGISKKDRLCRYIKKHILRKVLFLDDEQAVLDSFKKNKIDIVYAEYGPTGVAVTEICRQLNLPLIINFHGFDASVKKLLDGYKDSYKRTFEYASKVISVSRCMYSQLVKIGCPPEKLEYITYGPADMFFDIQPTYKENSFLAIGRFTDKKAPYYTILALKKVIERYPDCKLYIAGDGSLLNSCINMVNYLKLDRNIVFLGVVNHEELIPYYERVKAFVQHSVTAMDGDMEGTPVAIIEASAAALPVISTKHAGIPDVIIDGVTGLLVDEHDVDKMADSMIRLLDEEISYVRKLGEAGRKNIKDYFSMKIHIDKLNQAIKDVIKNASN